MSQYSIDYSGTEAEQTGLSPVAPNDNHNPRQTVNRNTQPREIRFTIPSIVKTATIFITGAAALFSWETYAPEGYRVSTLMGTYDARIAAAVKAAELQQQSGYDAWSAQVKLAADQQSEQYKAVMQGFLANYTATYDLNKINAQAAMDFQNRYASTLMNQKTQEQGTDIGIINLARGAGRILNTLQPGTGDDALNYANTLSGTLQDEVTEAARRGAGTSVVDWQTKLASPAEVGATLASIKPLLLPAPPKIGETRATIGQSLSAPR